MTKSNIAEEIALYLTNDATCKCVITGITWVIDVIGESTRPAVLKPIRKTDTVFVTIYFGTETAEPLSLGYQIRRYSTTIFIQADTEDNLQLAYEELQTAFNCWEANGGGAFQTGGREFHRLVSFDVDTQGRASARCTLILQSKMEARPT